jgi:hypothetical protein
MINAKFDSKNHDLIPANANHIKLLVKKKRDTQIVVKPNLFNKITKSL